MLEAYVNLAGSIMVRIPEQTLLHERITEGAIPIPRGGCWQKGDAGCINVIMPRVPEINENRDIAIAQRELFSLL